MMTMAKQPNSTDLGNIKDAQQSTEFEKSKKKDRHTPTSGWITKFRKRPGNKWLEEIDREFLRDFSNLTGLDEEICYLSHAYNIIMSDGLYIDSNGNRKYRTKAEGKHLDAAEKLYYLTHARYMLSNKGIEKVVKKYKEGFYGTCPRYYCEKTKVLPIGISDKLGEGDVKVYCPSCEDVYHSKETGTDLADGASFGTSFPQMFYMAHPPFHPGQPTIGHYTPKLYGFKIHGSVEHLQGEDSMELNNKMRHKYASKHHSLKTCTKDKNKDDCKENNASHQNTFDKLPDINGHCNSPEMMTRRRQRRRRKKTTEIKIQ